jgi:hypothetical protein
MYEGPHLNPHGKEGGGTGTRQERSPLGLDFSHRLARLRPYSERRKKLRGGFEVIYPGSPV